MKLALIVGHTRVNPGARAVSPINEFEYEYNNKLAIEIYRLAKSIHLDCKIFSRDGLSIEAVYGFVNDWCKLDNSVSIELHFNAFNGKIEGTEVLFDIEPNSVEFAREIQERLVVLFKRKGKRDRGIKLLEEGDRGHRNLKASLVTSVIVEPFFGDNPEDAKLGFELKNKYAKVLVTATIAYLRTLHRKEHSLSLH